MLDYLYTVPTSTHLRHLTYLLLHIPPDVFSTAVLLICILVWSSFLATSSITITLLCFALLYIHNFTLIVIQLETGGLIVISCLSYFSNVFLPPAHLSWNSISTYRILLRDPTFLVQYSSLTTSYFSVVTRSSSWLDHFPLNPPGFYQ